ncbi:MAG: NTP transferase domain-containing protein [Clostridia bacterium]|nr:NTP transferase domain-containing protein [Clostridia bacterium]
MQVQTVLMAAGEGTRMRSDISKVLHKVCGRTLLDWSMAAAPESPCKPIVIVGRNEAAVRATYGDKIVYAVQKERLGTGHAVMMAEDQIRASESDAVLIIAGDMPMYRPETFEKLCEGVLSGRCDAAVLTCILEDPTGYGRIIRDENGHVVGVVEQKDAKPEQLAIKETNVSGYCVKRDLLLDALGRLTNENAQHEYYITDIVGILVSDGRVVEPCVAEDPIECIGINDRVQLAQAEREMRARINDRIMRSGVTLIDPENTYIEADVQIDRDTVIWPNVVITNGAKIGRDCTIYSGSQICGGVIGNGVTVTSSVLCNASVADGESVGPFAVLK